MDGVEVYRLIRDVEATMNRDIAAELNEETANAANQSVPQLHPSS
ncbi:MAG: hypothetical protein P4L80_09465 [Xanthobacteraceae bacterium]|nr:hypothetical protein [Xanthobacteraceae bacterium]